MNCAITLGMMLASASIATSPCDDFAAGARPPRLHLASLETMPAPMREPPPIAAPKPTAAISIENNSDRVSTLVVVTKEKTIRTEVLRANAAQWKGFLVWLAGIGYPIDDVGCYSFRYINSAYTGGERVLSEHAKWKACDINQCDRNRVGLCRGPRLVKALPFPKGTNEMAHKFGLFPGAEWRHTPDTGHFQTEATIAEGSKHWPVALEPRPHMEASR